MKIRRIFLGLAGALLLLLAVAWFNAWTILDRLQESRDAAAEVRVRPLRGSVVLIEATLDGDRPYSYVASVASLGADGALLVDSMVSAALATKITAALAARSAEVRYIINTHAHPDHTRGNVAFAGGPTIVAHREAALEMAASLRPFPILPATRPLAEAARPTLTFDDSHRIEINDERVTLRHFGPAHTAGDTFVFFERANIVHVGDTFFGSGGRAVASPISGGSFEGLIAALDQLLDSTNPETLIVGGHGPLGAVWRPSDVARYRTILRAGLDLVAQAREAGETGEASLQGATLPGWDTWADGASADPLLQAMWQASANER